MKIEVSDATTLPEWLQPHVSEGSLDLGAVPPPENVDGLKSTVVNLRGQLEGWGKLGKHPDELSSRIAELTEKSKGNGKGADDAQIKLDAMALEHETQNTARDDKYNKLLTRTSQSDLKAELAKVGFVSEAIDMVANTAMGRLQFNEDGSPKVMTFDGKPMIGNGADHGATLADLAKELAEANPFAVKSNMLPGGGKPPGQNGGTPNQVTVTRAQFDSMSQGERSTHAKSGGAVKG